MATRPASGQQGKRRGRRPTTEITEPQRSTLRAIRAFIAKRGFPPTMKELGDILGIAPASAHEQVSQLVRKGFVRRDPRKARSIEIVEEPEQDVADLAPVPIVGTVAAGVPLLAQENIVGELLVERGVVRGGRHFALEVSGDSMVRADIHDGDYVVVRQQPIAESGDIVVALLGDEATVKRLSIAQDRIELRPENPRYRSMVIGPDDDLRIQGKVVAVRRRPPDERHSRSRG
jgi:repressor LexA